MSESTRPPKSAHELLERYDAGEREFAQAHLLRAGLAGAVLTDCVLRKANLSNANLVGADLRHSILRGANLRGADLTGADLREAKLTDASLEGAKLGEADLRNSDFQRARLKDANLVDANLHKADFAFADLSGADLSETQLGKAAFLGATFTAAKLDRASMKHTDLRRAKGLRTLMWAESVASAQIDAITYRESGWDPRQLAVAVSRGVVVENLHDFPLDARVAIIGDKEGLTLQFNTRITPFDRYLVDGLVFEILGRDTDCEVKFFEQDRDTAIIRLSGSRMEDLERLATAIWDRVWEATEERQLATLGVQLFPYLTAMREKLEHIVLWQRANAETLAEVMNSQPSEAANEATERWAEIQNSAADVALLRTWGQDALMTAGDAIRRKVLPSVARSLAGQVLPDDDDDDNS